MSTLDEVRTLRATALRLLPGFWQARAQVSIAIEVLEYFARDAEHELKTGVYTRRPIDRQIAGDIRVLQSMLSAFQRIHEPRE
jgi:hypothetical protein